MCVVARVLHREERIVLVVLPQRDGQHGARLGAHHLAVVAQRTDTVQVGFLLYDQRAYSSYVRTNAGTFRKVTGHITQTNSGQHTVIKVIQIDKQRVNTKRDLHDHVLGQLRIGSLGWLRESGLTRIGAPVSQDQIGFGVGTGQPGHGLGWQLTGQQFTLVVASDTVGVQVVECVVDHVHKAEGGVEHGGEGETVKVNGELVEGKVKADLQAVEARLLHRVLEKRELDERRFFRGLVTICLSAGQRRSSSTTKRRSPS
mmetsp:Transcript_7174/g.21993  ORF Transcript_7174/g.21993 Transcript_7174/m.21993 type:complete len:258 (+) Transcript_7174:796-1569(+)